MSSPVDEKKTLVFLEDVDPSHPTKKPEAQSGSQSSQTEPSSSQEQVKMSNKRQRTIEDMFFGGNKGKESAKKIKLSTSGTNGTSTNNRITVSAPKTSGLQKLNSIPFSLSSFIDSLNTEQKELLRLECEVMGKSWYVMTSLFIKNMGWLIK